jgi:hypothetical protein
MRDRHLRLIPHDPAATAEAKARRRAMDADDRRAEFDIRHRRGDRIRIEHQIAGTLFGLDYLTIREKYARREVGDWIWASGSAYLDPDAIYRARALAMGQIPPPRETPKTASEIYAFRRDPKNWRR